MSPGKKIEIQAERVERMIGVLAALTTGDYEVAFDVDEKAEDEFTQVEYSINFLIEQLAYERGENEQKQQALEEQLGLVKQQQLAILELSTPNIKVWDGVLVIPIIGTLDTRRSQRLTEELLTKLGTTQSRVAIIDITGVPTVDSAVANHILKTVSAVELLGAKCVITGIRPEVAQTIVHLGVDLSSVETLSNLAEGLKWTLAHLNLEIKNKSARDSR
ncbi:STAS domain-containing protein [bacterium]|nr:STAS domain-containing protein [bacterium]